MSKCKTLMLALILSLAMISTAYSYQCQRDCAGWQCQNGDGICPVDGCQCQDGQGCYYDSNGSCPMHELNPDESADDGTGTRGTRGAILQDEAAGTGCRNSGTCARNSNARHSRRR